MSSADRCIGYGSHTALKAFGVSAGDLIFQMVGNGRTPAVTLVKAFAVLTRVDAKVAKGLKNLSIIPDIEKSSLPYGTCIKPLTLQKGTGEDITCGTHTAGQLGRPAQI